MKFTNLRELDNESRRIVDIDQHYLSDLRLSKTGEIWIMDVGGENLVHHIIEDDVMNRIAEQTGIYKYLADKVTHLERKARDYDELAAMLKRMVDNA